MCWTPTCGANFACGSGSRKPADTSCYVDGGCTAAACCVKVAVCGDHVLDANEECDDGNTGAGDGCSATCKSEALAATMVDLNYGGTVGGGAISGATWTQSGAWVGARGDVRMCYSGDPHSNYSFQVLISKGTYHQIGVAPEACCAGVNTAENYSGNFAALYSHTDGWNRVRGSATYVGSPSRSKWWSGTWDHAPKTMNVIVRCGSRSFQVGIEGGDEFLGEMSWPSSWGGVYPFTAGDRDHVMT